MRFPSGRFAVLVAQHATQLLSTHDLTNNVADFVARFVFRRGNLDGAYWLLAAAREKHIELPLAEVMLARFCFAHNKGEEGKQLLERAVANHAEDPEAYLMLGEIAIAGGNLTEADGLYGLALEKIEPLAADNPRRSPLFVAAHSGSALVDERRQLWSKAEAHLHDWISLEPNQTTARSAYSAVLGSITLLHEQR